MNYKELGLSNTREMFAMAAKRGYAVPAFNFNNMEQLQAILTATARTRSPVILQVSESAMKYMGDDILIGMVGGALTRPAQSNDCAGAPGRAHDFPVALHLDHGRTFEICKHAIDIGFSSVMIDASDKTPEENIAMSKRVADYAHPRDVTVEAELGGLYGIEEDAPTLGSVASPPSWGEARSHYTNPADVARFVRDTGIDSLAISIGTSHGAYKFPSFGGVTPKGRRRGFSLRFDILEQIRAAAPKLPLVLHGASSVPQSLIDEINKFGGEIQGARGIPRDQLRKSTQMGICKINVDSDGRLAFTAAVRAELFTNPGNFDPRKYLSAARDKMTELYTDEIENVMGSGGMA
ncbi:MAG: ketose-bisphosphate aldolase [Proteobacteria bacterium]|nr:ketose-bisphosphate aldolase [Pseudomonadota bacterium]